MSKVSNYLPPPTEIVVSPSPGDWDAIWHGAGDDIGPPLRRGEGTRLRIHLDGPGTETATIRFAEPVEFLDGEVYWDPDEFGHDDLLSFNAYLPATTVEENVGGTGNCNLVDTGEGYNMIVPAAGDGAYDVDLDEAVPVPLDGEGYWDCDHDTGVITASTSPGAADWIMLDVPMDGGYFIKSIPMGSPIGTFAVDNYRVMWLHPTWRAILTCEKTSAGAGDLSAWAMVFRLVTT